MYNAIRNPNRHYGVEIECFVPTYESTVELRRLLVVEGVDCRHDGYGHEVRPHWKMTSDGSIRPFGRMYPVEIVSPILCGVDGLQQIRKVCTALATVGARVNRSCGLHVHHEASDFNSKTFKRILDLYKAIEVHIDRFMPESRRGDNNHFAMTLTKVTSVRNWGQTRYYKVNLLSWERHGTIEFRQHSGTIEADKIVAWVHLTQHIVERALGRSLGKTPYSTEGFLWNLRLYPCKRRDAAVSDDLLLQLRKFYIDRTRFFGFPFIPYAGSGPDSLANTAVPKSSQAPAEEGEVGRPNSESIQPARPFPPIHPRTRRTQTRTG